MVRWMLAAAVAAFPFTVRADEWVLNRAELSKLLIGRTISMTMYRFHGVVRNYYAEGDTQFASLGGILPKWGTYHIEDSRVCYNSGCIVFRRAGIGRIIASDQKGDVGEITDVEIGDVDHMQLKGLLPRLSTQRRN